MSDTPRFVVRRANWRGLPGGGFVRLPGDYSVSAFDTFDAADTDRARREAAARGAVNPFACGASLFYLTHFAPPQLADWLLDAGLEPPAPPAPVADWRAWWDEARPGMADEQAAHGWQGLDKLRFYEVREEPERPALELVLRVEWANREWTFEAEYEGGLPVAAFRDPAAAENSRAGREAVERTEVDEYTIWDRFEYLARDWFAADPFAGDAGPSPARIRCSVRDAPFFETAPVGVRATAAELARARSVFVLQRLTYRLATDPGVSLTRAEGQYGDPAPAVGVPVAAFTDPDEAWREAWRLDESAHPFLNPFWFGPPGYWTDSVGDDPRLSQRGFWAFVADRGLGPVLPAEELDWWAPDGWRRWWDATAAWLTPDQRLDVWAVLERLRLHEVVEVPVEG
jgi:hypothetical protein